MKRSSSVKVPSYSKFRKIVDKTILGHVDQNAPDLSSSDFHVTNGITNGITGDSPVERYPNVQSTPRCYFPGKGVRMTKSLGSFKLAACETTGGIPRINGLVLLGKCTGNPWDFPMKIMGLNPVNVPLNQSIDTRNTRDLRFTNHHQHTEQAA